MKYNLSHGDTTTDVDTYAKSWRSLAAPIEVITGYVLHSFDPGLTFRNPEGRDSFQLSTHVAQKIVDSIPPKDPPTLMSPCEYCELTTSYDLEGCCNVCRKFRRPHYMNLT